MHLDYLWLCCVVCCTWCNVTGAFSHTDAVADAGTIAGIAIGAFVLLVVVVVTTFIICRWR